MTSAFNALILPSVSFMSISRLLISSIFLFISFAVIHIIHPSFLTKIIYSPTKNLLDFPSPCLITSPVYCFGLMGAFGFPGCCLWDVTPIPTTLCPGSFVLILKDSSGDLVYCFHIRMIKPYDFICMSFHANLIITIVCIKHIS